MSSRKIENKMFTLGESTFTTTKVAGFFEAMRAIGMEGKYQLPRRDGVRQYVICGVFAEEEIESFDDQNLEIKTISDQLLKMAAENKDGKFGRKFVCKGRVAVLLNNFGTHGEARLFDPDGTILKDIGIKSGIQDSDVTEKQNLLETMKERFVRKFGNYKTQYIVLFSHLIPCTIEGHECSKLLREYAEREKDCIIVSYDMTYQDTNTKLAWNNLTHENIHLVKPTVRRAVINSDIRDIQRSCGIMESFDPQYELVTPGDQYKTCVPKRQRVREKNAQSKKLKRAVLETATMRSVCAEDEPTEAEGCASTKQKVPGEELKSVRPVRDGKRKKQGEYRRQSSKSDRNKLWE